MKSSSLSIVLPTYNELKNIKILIEQIEKEFKKKIKLEIIVDDSSPDGTANAARALNKKYKNIRVIVRKNKEGIGAALRDGYNAARNDLILSSDSDLSFSVKDMLKLIDKIKQGYDLVIGSRHMEQGYYEKKVLKTRIKGFVSNTGNKVVRILTGVPIHDFSANFRVIRRDVWRSIKTKEKTNIILLEMILKTYYKKYKVAEVPVAFKDRIYGESKLNLAKEAPKFFMKMLLFVINLRILKKDN